VKGKNLILQILEIIIGLVSIGALFFKEFQLTGILLLFIVIILIIIHYNINLPQYTIFSHHAVLEIFDVTGEKAKVSRETYRRCNHKGISEIVYKNLAADGTLANFKSNIDPKLEVTKQAEQYIVKVRFDRGLKKFQPVYDTLEWDLLNSFFESTEFWQCVVDYPTYYVKLEIILPDKKRCIGKPKVFLCKGAEDEELSGLILSPDNRRIIWEKKSFLAIKSGTRFRIEWNW